MKKILITGGSGFVGSHTVDKLLNLGHYIVCLDNFYTSNYDNIKKLESNKNFHFIKHDLCNEIKIDEDFDEIYNLACPASPIQYQRDPLYTIKTSVLGALNICDFALKKNAKLIHASTSEVYGDPMISPQVESYWGNVNPIGLRACYDEGKRCAETILINYNIQHNLVIKIIRIFNTYGPNMELNDGRVISNFIVQALKNEDITIYGDGSQTRSFQYVDDLISGMIEMMNTKNNFLGPVNLGNPNEFSINELAKIIVKLTKSKSKLIYMKLPSDDPKRRRPDINLAQSTLNGWTPKYDLIEGLEKTIQYFRKKLNIN